jgi:hypothetical protein
MRFLKQVFKEWCLISSPGIILFYLALMRAAPLVRALAGCYGGNVSFSFDSNGRSVGGMALFGKGAPPLTLLRRAQDRLRDSPSRRLRTGPSGFLRLNRPLALRNSPVILRRRGSFAPSRRTCPEASRRIRLNGRWDGTSFPQGERPTTHAGHPEEARLVAPSRRMEGLRTQPERVEGERDGKPCEKRAYRSGIFPDRRSLKLSYTSRRGPT